MVSLKSNAFEIGNEFGIKPDHQHLGHRPSQHLAADTDDVDHSLDSKRSLSETKRLLEVLLKWFDELMFRRAETQSDQCITQ